MNELLPFDKFFNTIDRIFHSEDWFNDWARFFDGPNITTISSSVPTDMKIKENKDIEISMAIAGYPKENVEIDFDGDYLNVTLRKIERKEHEKERYVCKSIKNSFAKQKFVVPASRYAQENTKADLKDGLLTITIPSKEENKAKKVNINID